MYDLIYFKTKLSVLNCLQPHFCLRHAIFCQRFSLMSWTGQRWRLSGLQINTNCGLLHESSLHSLENGFTEFSAYFHILWTNSFHQSSFLYPCIDLRINDFGCALFVPPSKPFSYFCVIIFDVLSLPCVLTVYQLINSLEFLSNSLKHHLVEYILEKVKNWNSWKLLRNNSVIMFLNTYLKLFTETWGCFIKLDFVK
jgi:hypothetical protein